MGREQAVNWQTLENHYRKPLICLRVANEGVILHPAEKRRFRPLFTANSALPSQCLTARIGKQAAPAPRQRNEGLTTNPLLRSEHG
jgi:hypothetical protein